MDEFTLVWDAKCSVAESPTWDERNRRLLFCDINGRRILALHVDSDRRETWDVPDVVGSFGLCRSGRLVIAQRHHIALFDPAAGTTTRLTQDIDEPPHTRFNDGKVGPDGAFWVGTIDENSPRQKIAALYRVTPDGRIERQESGYANSNGLAWSVDGRTMYHADSGPGVIEAWDFEPASGARTNRRVLATLTSEDGRPDGAATDRDGTYWVAGPSAGCLNAFSPDGTLIRKWPFPVPGPTMPCFAGEDLYVTTLRDGKSPEVLAQYPGLGGLFRTRAPAAGVPVATFQD